MFIRDPWSTLTLQQAGSSLTLAGGDPVPVTDRVLLRQLHDLALAIYQAQQDVKAAQGRGDAVYVQARLQDVQRLRGLFAEKAQQFQTNDPTIKADLDAWDRSVGRWVEAVLQGLPGAIAAVPLAIGSGLLQGSIPWVILGGVALWLLSQAEKSKVIQRLVR